MTEIDALKTRTITTTWLRFRGWVMAITALVACPCHLPITLPILVSLAAGSALGAWAANNTLLIYAVATIYFLGGGALALKWLYRELE